MCARQLLRAGQKDPMSLCGAVHTIDPLGCTKIVQKAHLNPTSGQRFAATPIPRCLDPEVGLAGGHGKRDPLHSKCLASGYNGRSHRPAGNNFLIGLLRTRGVLVGSRAQTTRGPAIDAAGKLRI